MPKKLGVRTAEDLGDSRSVATKSPLRGWTPEGPTDCAPAGHRLADGDRPGRATSLAAPSRESNRNTRAG